MRTPRRFAVIGAGLAGLACARTLLQAGAAVTVFEREAFPSGRAATMIDATGPYDHGAQYFTATEARFTDQVGRWQSAGVVQPWRGRVLSFENGMMFDKSGSAERFVAVPGMRRLGIDLAQGLDVRCSTPVRSVQRGTDGWFLQTGKEGEGDGPFEAVLVAAPSQVAVTLLDGLTALTAQAQTIQWDPCWAVTMALPRASGAEFVGAFINDDPILGWAALDSAKPRRGQVDGVAERWVLHARPQWSQRFVEMNEQEVTRWMVRSFCALLRGRSMAPFARAKLWPHATPVNPLPQSFLWDEEQRLGMAGDWCGGPRIEGAYLSGLDLAQAALQ